MNVLEEASKKNINNSLSHIAIIMDGNGRWAKKRNLPRISGHKKGAIAIEQAIAGCIENNIKYLTLYAFSSENWNRPNDEVKSLMGLLEYYLDNKTEKLHEENIKLIVIGKRDKLDKKIIDKITYAEEKTKKNEKLTLTIAINYGSRDEIITAIKNIINDFKQGNLTEDDINQNKFNDFLYTKNIPDPDLLIRTSGELRISNFLLWQLAYTELYFTTINWPDFTKEHLNQAILEFLKRERRYGTS